ncbi:hypothetical protein [Amycolatopsis sp. NPDC059021]|uniref:hypothetical protein n=1 Tax=Amycolatopsis sp. NPDC059021 TaxID=3346704 RepID=UPI003672DA3F
MALTIAGSLLDLFRSEQSFSPSDTPTADTDFHGLVLVRTAWENRLTVGGATVSELAAPVGFPLVLAAVLLLAATVVAGRYVSTGSAGALARWLTSAGAVFLAGAVSTIAMGGVDLPASEQFGLTTTTMEPGMWLLVVAVVAAAGAAVLIHLRSPEPAAWANPALAFADIPTPSAGVSITVLPPEPPPAPPWAPKPGERS